MSGGNAKIPSVLYYDKTGKVCAAGAEAERDGIDILAEEGNWFKAEWFKLHLHPKKKEFATGPAKIPNLPPNKNSLGCLTHPGIGTSIWEGREIHYILSHPNGWGGTQQAAMRLAAERAGLITPGGRNKISFITEGEASLNHCIEKGLMNESIKKGEGVCIVDAGGGTLDLSAYTANPDGKTFQEIAEAQCHLKGSIFVTEAAGEHLHKLLEGSKFVADIDEMKKSFDKSTKCSFRSPDDPYYIRGCGSSKDKNQKLKILAGKLRLEGSEVALFFEPAIECIAKGVLEQYRNAHKPISSVFLVGGFSANDYLFKRVTEALEPHNLKVFRPDTYLSKVVAEGSVSFVLDHPVRSRLSPFSYGTDICLVYDSDLQEHRKRLWQCSRTCSGTMGIPGVFSIILPKNTQVKETQEFRSTYRTRASSPLLLKNMEQKILCYRGNKHQEKDQFMDEDPNNYSLVCTVKANLARVPIALCFGPSGIFFEVVIDIVFLFGLTELKAQIAWNEGGVEKRLAESCSSERPKI
ncbi:hypothetical protein NP233_g5879 [Leucocoprinus birnbaumii]|uniref:Uncharacterized protein n=1 Tax=Leucocoprinus birnbaumii TaxID=56174 RepID=A0AAD5YW97_9AGAR|nr:hypothetical protein NP233_g5879 [Leucocoprinus birnbaumii]